MIVGFNHNVTYRGNIFHVQTEDSGPQRPQLVTLLYHGGTIISSKKTLYSDIIKVDNLEKVVEELAKEQHKGMLRGLTHGDFDRRIEELGISLEGHQGKEGDAEKEVAKKAADPAAFDESGDRDLSSSAIVAEPIVDKFKKPKHEEPSLNELIYAYLTAGQR